MADAGGGTLDISSYAIRGTAPLVIEEIAPPDCKCPELCVRGRNADPLRQVSLLDQFSSAGERGRSLKARLSFTAEFGRLS